MSEPTMKHFASDDGSREGWLIWCPGCGWAHPLATKDPRLAWDFNGSQERPTFSPSFVFFGDMEHGGKMPRCHFFLRDGRLQFLGDSKHSLAGQTVALPPWRGMENNETVAS